MIGSVLFLIFMTRVFSQLLLVSFATGLANFLIFFLKNQLIVSLIFFPIAVPFSISLIPLWIVSFFLLALGYFPLQF